MQILTDSEARDDLRRLEAAWETAATFAFVPERSAVPRQWLEATLDRLPEPWRRDHFVLLTSGTTGQPKLVVGARERAEALARLLDQMQLGDAAAATVLALPLTYCYAFVNQWLWARVMGRALIPTAGFADPQALCAALAGVERGMLCLVGAQVPLLRQFLGDAVFPGVVRVHFAGGAFPQAHLAFLAERFPNALVFNNYGCAEAMPRLTLRRADAATDGANVGAPLPGIELACEDDGRLRFRSPYGAVGVVDAAGVHAIGPADWTETGDLAMPAADGSWVLTGRASEVFKRYGEKVSLPQILARIAAAWPGEAACYRECDPAGEEGAVLVLAPVPEPEALRRVLAVFREHFSRPHWPLRIEAVAALPRLPNGKTDVGGLRGSPSQALWRQRLQ